MAEKPALEPIGTVKEVRGRVTAVNEDGKPRPLSKGYYVFLYDKIQVLDNAFIDIELRDGRYLFFGRNTEKLLDRHILEDAHTLKPKF